MSETEVLTFEQIREMFQEIGRKQKITDKMIGDLGNRFGELAEHMVAPSINEKFRKLGFIFEETSLNKKISGCDSRSDNG